MIDSHKQKASEIFNIPYEEVTPEQRKYAKGLNYSLLYTPNSRLDIPTSKEAWYND